MRRLILSLFALSFVACADPVEPEPAESTATAAISWDCAAVCFEGRPCRNFCKLTLDEPGFAMDPVPTSCNDLRPINVCGDRCCDNAEADRLSPAYCRKDCQLARLEIANVNGHIQLIENKLTLATVERDYVSVAPACK
jgi:hypothetical protein